MTKSELDLLLKPTQEEVTAIQLINVSKTYDSLKVLSGLNFDFHQGKIYGLIGENGAGKTTLLKLIHGLETPSDGHIKTLPNLTVGMVHQHLMLGSEFTVQENLELTMGPTDQWLDRWVQLSTELKINEYVQLDDEVNNLSLSSKQKIEIAKCLLKDAKIILLDEPTSSLAPAEAEELFQQIKRLKQTGCCIILVSHKIKDILHVSDEVIVLTSGRFVSHQLAAKADPDDLARKMIRSTHQGLADKKVEAITGTGASISDNLLGDSLVFPAGKVPAAKLKVIEFQISEFKCAFESLKNFSLSVPTNQLIGLGGVDGNGQRAFIEWLFKNQPEWNILTEDRHLDGCFLDFTTFDNFKSGFVNERNRPKDKTLKNSFVHWQKKLAWHPPEMDQNFHNLSGGNQQKVVLARTLAMTSRQIALHNPTRGLDQGSVEKIYAQLKDLAEQGHSVLVISSDLDELLLHCEAISIFYKGKIAVTQIKNQFNKDILSKAMGGLL